MNGTSHLVTRRAPIASLSVTKAWTEGTTGNDDDPDQVSAPGQP
jgi:hypothetical protein